MEDDRSLYASINDPVPRRKNRFNHNDYIQSLPPGVREDMLKGGQTQSPLGDAAMLGATYVAVKNPLPVLEAIGAVSTDAKNFSDIQQELLTQRGGLNPVRKAKNIGKGLQRIGNVVSDIVDPRQVEVAGAPSLRINARDVGNPNVMKFDLPNNKRLLDIEEANRTAAQNARDTYTSTKATVTSDPTDIQVYDLHAAKKAIKADIPKELGGKLNTLTRIPEAPSKQFHHIFLKDLASEYVQAARRMGTPDEVIQLDRIAKKYGFGLGNYKSAGDYLDTVPHSLGHKEALLSKVQPSGESLKLKKSGIKDIGNIKELHEDFEKTIKEVVMPMKEVMDEFQDIWDTIPPKERLKLIKLRLNRAALRKRFKTKAEGKHWELDSATNAYRKQKDKLKKETFKTKGWRKQHRENVSELKFDQQLKDAYDEFSKN